MYIYIYVHTYPAKTVQATRDPMRTVAIYTHTYTYIYIHVYIPIKQKPSQQRVIPRELPLTFVDLH